jgi:hypothetical protein
MAETGTGSQRSLNSQESVTGRLAASTMEARLAYTAAVEIVIA